MKVNWAYLKKPSVIIGAVILFFVVLFLLNRGGGSASSNGTVVNTGPSDAQVAAANQMAMAQISAGLQGQALALDFQKSQDANQTQIALATLAAAAQNQSLAVQQDIAESTIGAQVHGLDLQYQTALANNNFALDYAQQQFAYGLASQGITAHTQIALSEDMLRSQQIQTNASIVMGLVGHNKYSSIALPAYFGSQQNNTASYSQVGTIS